MHHKDVFPMEKLFPFHSKTARVLRTKASFMTQEGCELSNMTVHRHERSGSVPCNKYGAEMGSGHFTDELTLATDDING